MPPDGSIQKQRVDNPEKLLGEPYNVINDEQRDVIYHVYSKLLLIDCIISSKIDIFKQHSHVANSKPVYRF